MSRERLTYIPAMNPTAVATGQSGFHESGAKYHPNPNTRTGKGELVSQVNPGGWPDPKEEEGIVDLRLPNQDGVYVTDEMEKLVNSLPELPGEQSYIVHQTVRGESFSSEVGVIYFDDRGVSVVPHNIARHLDDRNDGQFLIKYGTLEKSFTARAKTSPQHLKIEEELENLREKVKVLESLKVNETDAKFVSKLKESPEVLGLINLLLHGKKEVASLFLFLGETINEKKYGLAIATFWKAFEEEFKNCPKSLEKILVDAGVQFEESPTVEKKKSKRGKKKRKSTKTSSAK